MADTDAVEQRDDQAAEPRESREYAGLSEEDVQRENAFMEGIPRFNWGAFLMPPIWGPAHGMWLTILYYPIWVLADNCLYAAFSTPSGLSITLAVLVVLTLAAATVLFGILAQPRAAHRAIDAGKTKAQYLRSQRIWAWVSAAIAVVFLALATYYNLVLR